MSKMILSLFCLTLLVGCGGGASNTVEAPEEVVEATNDMPSAGNDGVPAPPPLEAPPGE